MPFEDTYNPTIHRINQAVRERAIYPKKNLNDPAPILTKYQHPPNSLLAGAEKSLQKLIAVADVKKVDERKKGRGKRGRDAGPQPLSGLDVDKLLRDRKKKTITENNAIPEFKQMVYDEDENGERDLDTRVKEAMKQLGDITRDMIRKSSLGTTAYDMALRHISEMRTVAVELELPEPFNDFVIDLKEKISSGDLGERRDFWVRFKRSGLGLITQKESEYSKAGDEQVQEVSKLS
jgi:ATP-dependent DNA helicase 2 subunit 2